MRFPVGSWMNCVPKTPGSGGCWKSANMNRSAAREAQPELALHADGPVTSRSPAETKVAFYQSLFRARTDIYALRWENTKAGSSGWVPAVAGGWRKWMDRENAELPAFDPRRRRGAPARFRTPWPVPADQQRRLLLCRGRLRRRRGPARRPGLHQGGPPFPDPRGPGNFPVRARSPRLDLLHPGGAGRRRPGTRQRAARRGHEHPRVDVVEVLRQAFPVPGPAHRQGHGQPHCRPAQRKAPAARGHAVPGHRHAGTLCGPVGLPLDAGEG